MPFPYFPDQYSQQLADKETRLTDMFSHWDTPDLEVFPSDASNYRMRAEFRFWHEGDRSFYAMFNPSDRKTPLEVTDFPVASQLTNTLMTSVREAIAQDPELRFKLFQVEFLTTKSGDALITLIYHRQLSDTWKERANYWQEQWGFPVIGRARKQRHVLERDFVTESLTIANDTYNFHQYENSFTQPNAGVCEKMVTWAVENSRGNEDKDVMELYCGNGNFSIPIAQNFRNALATEISRTSVKSAQENIALNNIENLTIARMASEDLSKAWIHNEPNKKFNQFEIDSYDFDTILVDPPRAGLDEDTVELIKRFRRIIYVSCNPESMKENIECLRDSYSVSAFALFDQFPYTHHMEAGLVLERKE